MNLRNCPVCNNNSFFRYREGLAREADDDMYFIDDCLEHYIECAYCGHCAYGRSWEEVEELWNTEEPSQLELNIWAKRKQHEGTTT